MSVSKYFHVSNGLRGCYMPDSGHMVRVFTRKALKDHIESEARDMRDAGYVGASKAAIARLAATAWTSTNPYPVVMPLAPPHTPGEYSYGLFVAPADRAEWLEYLEHEGAM